MQTDWPAVGTLAFSIFGGGVAMAWRLGTMNTRLGELERRVNELARPWDGRERRRPFPRARSRA